MYILFGSPQTHAVPFESNRVQVGEKSKRKSSVIFVQIVSKISQKIACVTPSLVKFSDNHQTRSDVVGSFFGDITVNRANGRFQILRVPGNKTYFPPL